ncbi:hypothetical protein [Bosea sp. 685]|uniref:hypothetical protein n=1 Tax=Bosea sp. 685 TaxID=3080057 RepID=UPI002892C7E6|nr:hypothetical protein [Bosea sp. 685]WNJ88458.1 hypothetical protein RMR04_18810 [Bosea sp. 685]
MRFFVLRRLISLIICLALIAAGAWLFRPILDGGWPSGRMALIAAGMIGIGVAWLWSDYIERGDG